MFNLEWSLPALRHLGKIFPSGLASTVRGRYTKERFKTLFTKEVRIAKSSDGLLNRQLATSARAQIIESLFPVWQSFAQELEDRDSVELPENGAGAEELVHKLAWLAKIYSTPDLPKGMGSKSKRGGKYAPGMTERELKKYRVQLEELLDRSESIKWLPATMTYELSKALRAFTDAEVIFGQAMLESKHNSIGEAHCIEGLIVLLGKGRAYKTVDALVKDLQECGINHYSSANKWRLRFEKQRQRGKVSRAGAKKRSVTKD